MKILQKIPFLIFLFLFIHCSGLLKTEKAFFSSPPSELYADKERINFNFSSNSKRKILILDFQPPKEGSKSAWQYMILKNKNIWKKIELEQDNIQLVSKSDAGFDLVIETGFHFSENLYRMIQILRNPKGEAQARWDWALKKDNESPSSILYFDGETYKAQNQTPLKEGYVWKENPSHLEISGLLEDALSGKVSFYSNPSGEVECNGKKLGKTPLTKKLRQGVYECTFLGSGLVKKKKTIQVEPGREQKVVIHLEEKKHDSFWLVEAIPGPVEVLIHNKILGLTPITIPPEKKLNLKLLQSDKSYSVSLLPEYFTKNSLIIFPYMIWDAFNPIFLSFWDIPISPSLSFEMNSYLSLVNESKEEIKEWNFVKSHYFLPEKYRIEGSFFPPEETGQGVFLLSLGSQEDSISIEVEVDRVSLFHFPNSTQDVGTYFYPLTEKRRPRKFSLLTLPDQETVQVYLDEKHILSQKISFSKPWRFTLAGKGKIFNRMNALVVLKIACPEILTKDQIEIWERGTIRTFPKDFYL